MPKAKPISLHPLSFEEAIKAIVRVDPTRRVEVAQRRNKTTAGMKTKKAK